MTDRAEVCRRRAEQCEQAAAEVNDERIPAAYHDMARQWRVMADQAEEINKVLLETRNPLLRS
jgi:hypothetical protein